MADKADLRVSDADREREAAVLREHYAAGRLDSSEFEERLQAVYGARTEGELESLSSDLPALPPKPPTRSELVRRAVMSNAMARNLACGVGAFAACTGIWALTSANGEFWPKYVLVFTLVTIVRGGSRGLRGRRISQAGGARISAGGARISAGGARSTADGGRVGADGGDGGGAGGDGGDGHNHSYRYE